MKHVIEHTLPPIDRDVLISPPQVLLVDDDEEQLFLLKRTLTKVGYGVDTAKDGNAGWDALNAKQYDLLITDHNMPGMTGLGLIRKLRQNLSLLPCILLSSLLPGTSADLEAEVKPGAAMEKMYPCSGLLAEIRSLLSTTAPRA